MSSPFPACDARFPARNHGGDRTSVKCGVVHCTGNDSTALATALYFHTNREAGSTQFVIDDTTCMRTLPDSVIPYGAPPMNDTGVHVEIEGPVTWKRGAWLRKDHRARLRNTAYRLARWHVLYDIPLHFVTDPSELPDNPSDFRGFTYHFVVSARYHQSTHDDPGPGFPYRYLRWQTKRYVAGRQSDTSDD